MPQIVRKLSARTRKVGELKVCFTPKFIRKSVRTFIVRKIGGNEGTQYCSAIA